MKVNISASRRTRPGHAVLLLALLLPVIIGVLTLCIDAGVFAVARSQLLTEADAAALAGAAKLNNPARINPTYDLSSDVSSAHSQALTFGRANKVLGQNALLNPNASNSASGDVVVGYIDMTTSNASLASSPAITPLFNSVQVKAQRTSDHGGSVPAYFSKLIGFGDMPITVQSTATVQNYAISGFKCSPSGKYTKLVPIALSQTTYNAMLSKLTTDKYTFQADSGTVLNGADGLFESSLYPANSGAGNWGTLRVGINNNSTSALGKQIQNGLTTDDISYSFGCSMALSPTIQSPGNPGVSLGLRPALQSLVGKTVIVPIYDPTKTTGSGSNMKYTIVKFAPVAVLNTYFNGVHSGVTVQPSLVTDATAVPGAPQASWASGGVVRLHLSR